jgi:hypothetical protein
MARLKKLLHLIEFESAPLAPHDDAVESKEFIAWLIRSRLAEKRRQHGAPTGTG